MSREGQGRCLDKEKQQASPSPSPALLKRACPALASLLCLSPTVFSPLSEQALDVNVGRLQEWLEQAEWKWLEQAEWKR